MTPFRLVESNWEHEFHQGLRADASSLRIACPFIKSALVKRLLTARSPRRIQVITRFNLTDACAGVTDLAALRSLLEQGAEIRGVRNLHAKLYVFGEARAVITSANLTMAAFHANHEFGVVAEHRPFVREARQYFDRLWRNAGASLSESQLAEWESEVTRRLAGATTSYTGVGLADYGVDLGIPSAPLLTSPWVEEPPSSFVKFFGEGNNRAERSLPTLTEVKRAGCHWACAWPTGKRPRQVVDGSLLYLGRLVKRPDDTIIFGRAIGMRHVPDRDDASPEEIHARSWKAKWSHYVRVHDAEFIAGTLANGISLAAMMESLRKNAFTSTQRNAAARRGNTDPRMSLRQQPAVELSLQGTDWLNEQWALARKKHGTVPADELKRLDWPTNPGWAPRSPSALQHR
jgi:hypothetical protein